MLLFNEFCVSYCNLARGRARSPAGVRWANSFGLMAVSPVRPGPVEGSRGEISRPAWVLLLPGLLLAGVIALFVPYDLKGSLDFAIELRGRKVGAMLLLASAGAVALFGLALVASRSIDWRAAALLLGLFATRWFFPDAEQRLWLSCIYLGLAGVMAIMS